jgi:hypothetical protein
LIFSVYNLKVKAILKVLAIVSFFLALTACGSKPSSMNDSGCYEIDGDKVVYTCENDSPDNPRANTGYDGPYNPKALNLYRPGRFENINAPVW